MSDMSPEDAIAIQKWNAQRYAVDRQLKANDVLLRRLEKINESSDLEEVKKLVEKLPLKEFEFESKGKTLEEIKVEMEKFRELVGQSNAELTEQFDTLGGNILITMKKPVYSSNYSGFEDPNMV